MIIILHNYTHHHSRAMLDERRTRRVTRDRHGKLQGAPAARGNAFVDMKVGSCACQLGSYTRYTCRQNINLTFNKKFSTSYGDTLYAKLADLIREEGGRGSVFLSHYSFKDVEVHPGRSHR